MSLGIYDFDNNILMADSRAYGGSSVSIGKKRKLHKVKTGPNGKPGYIVVSSRVVGMDAMIKAWFAGGCEHDDTIADRINNVATQEWIFVESKTCLVYLALNTVFMTGPLEMPGGIFVIGSEPDYALGTFDITKDARLAMTKTATYDKWSDFPIHGVNVKTGKEFTILE